MSRPRPPRNASLLPLLVVVAGAPADAQENAISSEGYLTPPEPVVAAVTAPRHEDVSLTDLNPAETHFLHQEGVGLLSLEEMARPHRNLGGIYVDPRAHRHRNLTVRGAERLELIRWEDGGRHAVELPPGTRASGVRWSPDGGRLAFLASGPEETHLYVADVETGETERLSPRPVLATRVTAPDWSGDGRFLFSVLVPEDRGADPAPPTRPGTPMIRVTSEDENRLRTFPTLLRDPHDRDLLEHHTTGQLVRVEVETGTVEAVGSPAMIESMRAGPRGEHVRIRTTSRPFSHIVPVNRFPDRYEVWDRRGESLALLAERDARKGVEDGPSDEEDERRQIRWRPDGAGLSFLQREPAPEEDEEAPDAGAADEEDDARKDRVMLWRPPFGEDDVEVVYEATGEIRDLRYDDDARTLFLTQRDDGEEHLYAVFLDEPEVRHTLYRHDPDDRLDDPGGLVTAPGALGGTVARVSPDGRHVYLQGTRYHEEPLENAPQPFLDRVEIRTGEVERIFESSPDAFERVSAVLDDAADRIVITRESPTDPPNAFVRAVATGEERQLTENVDHTPEITRASRDAFYATRADGFRFRVAVAMPADWDGEPLPAIFWHYPREYEDQEDYDQRTGGYNKNRFPSVGPRSAEIFLRAGYAVVTPDFPVVGDLDRVNDSFVTDLKSNWAAAIDAADRKGYIDRERIALGGHSYGGFGTIHALMRTPFFRAGIAGAPNSNRILTPMGFQREGRILWEARETYWEMSPILWAERMQGALLIYHGDDDQNVGTWPANSWRLIHALNGLGKTAALYMYPYEGHGPAARETLLDMWARWIGWMDHYVRDAEVEVPPAPVASDEEALEAGERGAR